MKLAMAVLAAALALGGITISSSASAATGPRWIIEQTQLANLPWSVRTHISASQGSVILADTKDAFLQNGTNSEHYTSIASCSTLDLSGTNYVAKCLSLDDAPPPAGTWALYDPEGWKLTPADEVQHECTAMNQAADIIKSNGATAIMAPSTDAKEWLMQCAAKAAAKTDGEVMVHLQIQPLETDLSTYMHRLRQATRWVHSVEPGMTVSFGVSTNPKYSPTAWKLYKAWLSATGYLGLSAPCWLNVIKPTSSTAIKMATRFVGYVYG